MAEQRSSLPAAAATPPDDPVRRLQWRGRWLPFALLSLANSGYTLITLGFYHSWAETRKRRFIAEHSFFLDEPFAYLGTGREIFFSAMRFALTIMAPLALMFSLGTILIPNHTSRLALGPLYGLVAMVLKLYARQSGWRYRANRLSWRGVRFRLALTRADYVPAVIKIGVLNAVTLGLYRPYGDARLLNMFINQLHFGTQPFTYQGDRRALTRGYWLIWLLTIPSLGLAQFWYKARLYRHVAASTRLGGMHFHAKIRGGSLLVLALTNGLLWVASLGQLGFLTVLRRIRFFSNRLDVLGLPDLTTIRQAALEDQNAGAADYFGVDDLGF